jgi:hypothetical protein
VPLPAGWSTTVTRFDLTPEAASFGRTVTFETSNATTGVATSTHLTSTQRAGLSVDDETTLAWTQVESYVYAFIDDVEGTSLARVGSKFTPP